MARDLRPLFFPDSVAVIGASSRPGSLAGAVLRNLVEGGYAGSLHPVHPRESRVLGLDAVPEVGALPAAPDLAVIGVPAAQVPATVDALLDRGTRAFLILTAGFGETGADGRAREAALAERCRAAGAVLLGPNCMGIHTALGGRRLDASFSRARPRTGNSVLLSQSGSITEWLLLRMERRGLGAALAASLGNAADLDLADLLEGAARHFPEARTVLVYLETVPEAARLRRAVEALGDRRLLVLRGGSSAGGTRAVAGHTGALAAEPHLAAALLGGLGATLLDSPTEALDALEVCARLPRPSGTRVVVLTNAGGPAVLATDALHDAGAPLAPLPDAVRRDLAGGLPPAAVTGNPVDLLAPAGAADFTHALDVLRRSRAADALLTVFMHPVVTDAAAVARALAAGLPGQPGVVAWLAEEDGTGSVEILREAGIPVVPEPVRAARALARWLQAPPRRQPWPDAGTGMPWPETPPVSGGSGWGPPEILEAFLVSGRIAATGPGRLRLPPARRVGSPEAARAAAAELGYPLVVKIERSDTPHKRDAGLLAWVPEAARLEAALTGLGGRAGDGRWLLQRAVSGSLELYAGYLRHPLLGPFVSLGLGGTGMESGLPPAWLALPATRATAERFLRSAPVPGGGSGPLAEALAALVSRLAALAAAEEVAMAEVNPALWDPHTETLFPVDCRWQVRSG